VRAFLKHEIESRPHADPNSEACVADDIIAYYRSISKAQLVSTGEQALTLLLSSNRVATDISNGMLVQGKHFTTKIVIREWVDIEPENEFRMFVVKGVPTALTQYHKDCYVKEFLTAKEKIKMPYYQSLINSKA